MDSFESNISPGQANPSLGVELRKRTSKSVQDEYYAEMLHEEDDNKLLIDQHDRDEDFIPKKKKGRPPKSKKKPQRSSIKSASALVARQSKRLSKVAESPSAMFHEAYDSNSVVDGKSMFSPVTSNADNGKETENDQYILDQNVLFENNIDAKDPKASNSGITEINQMQYSPRFKKSGHKKFSVANFYSQALPEAEPEDFSTDVSNTQIRIKKVKLDKWIVTDDVNDEASHNQDFGPKEKSDSSSKEIKPLLPRVLKPVGQRLQHPVHVDQSGMVTVKRSSNLANEFNNDINSNAVVKQVAVSFEDSLKDDVVSDGLRILNTVTREAQKSGGNFDVAESRSNRQFKMKKLNPLPHSHPIKSIKSDINSSHRSLPLNTGPRKKPFTGNFRGEGPRFVRQNVTGIQRQSSQQYSGNRRLIDPQYGGEQRQYTPQYGGKFHKPSPVGVSGRRYSKGGEPGSAPRVPLNRPPQSLTHRILPASQSTSPIPVIDLVYSLTQHQEIRPRTTNPNKTKSDDLYPITREAVPFRPGWVAPPGLSITKTKSASNNNCPSLSLPNLAKALSQLGEQDGNRRPVKYKMTEAQIQAFEVLGIQEKCE